MSFITQPANLTTVSGTLGPTNGGTGLTSPGASGNILTSNGTVWTSAAPASGSAFNLISTVLSNGTDNFLSFTGLTVYKNYYVIFNNFPSNNATFSNNNFIQVGTGSPVTWITSGYEVGRVDVNPIGSFNIVQQTVAGFRIATGDANTTSGISGSFSLFNVSGGGPTGCTGMAAKNVPVGAASDIFISQGFLANTTAKTGIRFNIGGSTMSAGAMQASLYGISS